MPAVSFQNVSKTYCSARGELQALKGVSFDIQAGEFFGLLGPNGAGKTTTIKLVTGIIQPDSGTITLSSPFDGPTVAVVLPPHCKAETPPGKLWRA